MSTRLKEVCGLFGHRAMGLVVWCVVFVGLCLSGWLVEGRSLGIDEAGSLCGTSGRNVLDNLDSCCRNLVIANDQGCFCGGPPRHSMLSSAEACKLEIHSHGSLECASLQGFMDSLLVPKAFGKNPRQQRSEICQSLGFEGVEVTNQKLDALQQEGPVADVEDLLTDESFSDSRGLLLGVGGFFVTCASFLCPCWHRQRGMRTRETDSVGIISPGGSNTPSNNSIRDLPPRFPPSVPIVAGANFRFTMADIIRATDNFSPARKIGQGGFGLVYKGKLPDDQIVAIKRAKRDAFEARLSVEFQTEVNALSQVEHLNLVRLIGYLEENQERILVVEYVNNGNLREHLDGSNKCILDISKRLDIAIDVAHALTYLHTYSDRPIIHRDVKSSNILLTDTHRAKVADFGFSRTGPEEDGATHVSTQVKGTAGYLDPEYLNSYQLTQKSDVYSYGILLIEIFTGRRPIELKRASSERVTVRWAWKKVTDGGVAEILDPKLEKTQPALVMVEKVAELAFACSAPSRNDRPLMAEAVRQLWSIRTEYQAAIREYDIARSSSNMSTASLSSKKDRADYRYSYDSSGMRSPNNYMLSSPR